ncbi:MAG TPA: type II toxin-antitoxin system VapC family toxin [Devosia sp.]|nr:type II toxin-antitoxin system VapC family toxin [Devosia sp.]
MLDTNIVSHAMRYPEGLVARHLSTYRIDQIAVSILVVAELRYGIAKVNSERLARQAEWALSAMTIVPLMPPADIAYANTRISLEKAGTPIGPNDLWIAAHALALDLPLITANIGEFSRVPNLRVENWLD